MDLEILYQIQDLDSPNVILYVFSVQFSKSEMS